MLRGIALAVVVLGGCVEIFDLDDPVMSDDGAGAGSGSGSAGSGAGSGSGSGSASACPSGVVEGNRCFERYDNAVSWSAARDACVMRGAVLAKTETPAIRNAIATMLDLSDAVLIGATDTSTPGSYRWLDGTALTTGWLPYNPMGADDHCVALQLAGPLGWANKDCTDPLPYVCERAL